MCFRLGLGRSVGFVWPEMGRSDLVWSGLGGRAVIGALNSGGKASGVEEGPKERIAGHGRWSRASAGARRVGRGKRCGMPVGSCEADAAIDGHGRVHARLSGAVVAEAERRVVRREGCVSSV